MGKRNDQAREMTRAVNQLGEIVGELTLTINRFLDYQRELVVERREYSLPDFDPYVEDPSRTGMLEGEAHKLATDAVREARNMLGYGRTDVPEVFGEKLPPPGSEEVEEWERRREERRRRGEPGSELKF